MPTLDIHQHTRGEATLQGQGRPIGECYVHMCTVGSTKAVLGSDIKGEEWWRGMVERKDYLYGSPLGVAEYNYHV